MSEKTLKWIIYIAGIFSLYAFLAVRIFPMFNIFLNEKIVPEYWENTKYGELYYFNYIKNFREKNLPKCTQKYRFTDRHPKLQNADILLFGDSFFDFTRMKTFPEKLSDSLNKKVFYARYDYPLKMLYDSSYSNNRPKLLIYESAERFLPDRFINPHDSIFNKTQPGFMSKATDAIIKFLFPGDVDLKYSTLLARNYLTTDLYSGVSTLKFNAYKYITEKTPKYSTEEDIPWLFSWRQIKEDYPGSFYYKHTDSLMNAYCNNIANLAKQLDEKYHLKMVFMVIPSKYTIYHKLINNDKYNDFIPKLQAGLKKRNIPYIDVYSNYKNSKEILYYGTDTHWNVKGLNIALNNTIEMISNLNKEHNLKYCYTTD